MDEQKLNTLQTFLMAHGSSLEALPKARVNQLSKVYDAVEIRRKLHTAVASGSWCGAERQRCGASGSPLM